MSKAGRKEKPFGGNRYTPPPTVSRKHRAGASLLGLDNTLIMVYTGDKSIQEIGENMNSGHGGKRTPGPGKKLGPPYKPEHERYIKQHISLPPEQFAWLKRHSKITDIPMSRIIQLAIEEYQRRLGGN
jgi:hypothetical protein